MSSNNQQDKDIYTVRQAQYKRFSSYFSISFVSFSSTGYALRYALKGIVWH